jgi:hypothetical protein
MCHCIARARRLKLEGILEIERSLSCATRPANPPKIPKPNKAQSRAFSGSIKYSRIFAPTPTLRMKRAPQANRAARYLA